MLRALPPSALRSYTSTRKPRSTSSCATARPAIPPPRTATRLPRPGRGAAHDGVAAIAAAAAPAFSTSRLERPPIPHTTYPGLTPLRTPLGARNPSDRPHTFVCSLREERLDHGQGTGEGRQGARFRAAERRRPDRAPVRRRVDHEDGRRRVPGQRQGDLDGRAVARPRARS